MCAKLNDTLIIDGSHGEGGGQILRTALSLAAIAGRPLRIEQMRAGRQRPGLMAQHLTSVRAAAAICDADVEGDALGSQVLTFRPHRRPKPGAYVFDVTEAQPGGSAGAATLVLQTLLLPLLLGYEPSTVTVRGGTHVPWSPSFDYLQVIWLETMRGLGARVVAELGAWGFFPSGGGEIMLTIGAPEAPEERAAPRPFERIERGRLAGVEGRAVVANLPAHIAQRMAGQAESRLQRLGVPLAIRREEVTAQSPGAFIFLKATYENTVAGFCAHGRRGKPAEVVADEALSDLLAFNDADVVMDRHLADQMLLPLSFAGGVSEFTCEAVTRHLETNAWVIEQFGIATISITHRSDDTGHVRIVPRDDATAAFLDT